MLFTDAEVAEWERREREAYAERPGDTWNSRWKRKSAISVSYRNEKLARMRARPERVLRAIVTHAGERARVGVTSDELWGDESLLAERYLRANTPETRWLVRTMLSALLVVPRSWALSATTRFFRGIGKQKDAKYPGAGLFSADRGWTEREVGALVAMFYSGEVGALFMEDVSVDSYGEDGHEVMEDGGNRFAATRKDRSDGFIRDLIDRLDAEGVVAPVVPAKPEPKPRKARTFAPGDVVTRTNLRDLPAGSHLRMVVVVYDYGHGAQEFGAQESTFEMVFVSRETGTAQMRPVMAGKAFASRLFPSSNLYAEGYNHNEVTTTYLGPWAGEVLEVEIAREHWKPVSSRRVRRRREGTYPDQKIVPVDVP
jgi:hypothetical protein